MRLNPTLKNVLGRTACIVMSPIIYYVLYCVLFFIWPSLDTHNTIAGILAFSIALIVIWLNVRKLAKPIRLLTIGSYLLVFAVIIFWYKVEALPRTTHLWGGYGAHDNNYQILRHCCSIGFILLASMLPIFLESTEMPRLAKLGKIWMGIAVLMLDFAAAMPNIFFSDQMADKLYIGRYRMGNFRTSIYAIGNMDNMDSPALSVFLPQDSVYTEGQHYLVRSYEQQGNLLIQPETQDTIWIEKGGASRINPDHQTLENNTSCLMRWQWQYNAWHKFKRLFHKKENE